MKLTIANTSKCQMVKLRSINLKEECKQSLEMRLNISWEILLQAFKCSCNKWCINTKLKILFHTSQAWTIKISAFWSNKWTHSVSSKDLRVLEVLHLKVSLKFSKIFLLIFQLDVTSDHLLITWLPKSKSEMVVIKKREVSQWMKFPRNSQISLTLKPMFSSVKFGLFNFIDI